MLDRRFLSISVTVQGIANSPADNPTAGTQYIVGSNPTGVFAGATANSIARYDGSAWSFTAPKAGELEAINLQTGEILRFNGSAWITAITISTFETIAPVLAVVPTGTALPATADAGDAFLNTSDAKLYTATAANTWDAGTATANGSRYASSTDFKIYQSDGSALTATNIPNGGWFLNKEENALCIYDASVPAFVKLGGNSDSDSISTATEIHTVTAQEVTAKSFSLSHAVASGQEDNVLLFVSGVAQAVGTDFTASGSSISWTNKGLDSLGLVEGDTFIVHYIKG